MNIWGMILIGTGLFLGIFIRVASVSGILLLALYYFAYPPFGAAYHGLNLEGHFWIINKNLIEIFALLIIYNFPVSDFSLVNFFPLLKLRKDKTASIAEEGSGSVTGRREMLKGLAALPFFGGMLIGTVSRVKDMDLDALSGATVTRKKIDLSELKGELPKGKLGNLEVSRLYMGGNLILGISHSRDLDYVRQLFKQYNTEERLLYTFSLAEQAGINMANLGGYSVRLFNRFQEITGSKMMSCVQAKIDMDGNDRLADFKKSMDLGASTIYVHGGYGDSLCKNGRLDVIQEAVEFIQSQGVPAGIGAHSIQVLIQCEKAGIKPDYYFKSMHHDNYWSAHPRENRKEFSITGETSSNDHNHYHDNIWDIYPEQTVEVINKIEVPVMGFKVLAAGAIGPEEGFRYAFENGADFICVGMFDYQVVDNVNIVTEILKSGNLNRSRPWYS
jgi:hypothetical protein